jgi:multiple antibiotic resistance protein
MHLDVNQIISATMVLFAVIDILGSIPIIISLRQKLGHIEAEKATLAATLIMVSFLFIGERILHFLGVDVHSFAVAGAFVLFFLALEMILGVRLYKEDAPKSASIVPIAFPLVAGAGTMTTLVSIRAEYHAINILVAIGINMILVYGVLKQSARIEAVLGPGGLGILRKIFGVILMAIAVKLFATNIKTLF